MIYDLIIIGSGPAGYVSAIRAGQLGLKVAIIEKDKFGGMCLNWGCIPEKAVLETVKLYDRIVNLADKFGVVGIENEFVAVDWNKAIKRSQALTKKLTEGIEYLLKNNAVEILKGEAKIIDHEVIRVKNRNLVGKNIIIASGSAAPTLNCPDMNILVETRDLFQPREIPQNIVVVGKWMYAVEMAQIFHLMGRKVIMLCDAPSLLPIVDESIKNYFIRRLKQQHIAVFYNVNVNDVLQTLSANHILVEDQIIGCDLIINTSDRKGIIVDSDIDFKLSNGYYLVDEHFETSVKGIYAVGDCNGLGPFAHIGSAQGLNVINHLMGIDYKLDIERLPINMYTIPEAAQIGATEAQLKERGTIYKVSEFPLIANGKALTEGAFDGFIRILSDHKYGEVLGVQIIAPNATDLINEASAYIQMEATVHDIARTVHTHPTVSEVFMEVGLEGVDKAIHK